MSRLIIQDQHYPADKSKQEKKTQPVWRWAFHFDSHSSMPSLMLSCMSVSQRNFSFLLNEAESMKLFSLTSSPFQMHLVSNIVAAARMTQGCRNSLSLQMFLAFSSLLIFLWFQTSRDRVLINHIWFSFTHHDRIPRERIPCRFPERGGGVNSALLCVLTNCAKNVFGFCLLLWICFMNYLHPEVLVTLKYYFSFFLSPWFEFRYLCLLCMFFKTIRYLIPRILQLLLSSRQ